MKIFILGLLLVTTGCATPVSTLNFTPSDIIPNERKIDAALKTITISIAKKDEKLGKIQFEFFDHDELDETLSGFSCNDERLDETLGEYLCHDELLDETRLGFFGSLVVQSLKPTLHFSATLHADLEEAIARSAAFNDLSDKKVSLLAKVMKFQTPGIGINFKTEMIIRYELIDSSTGETLFFRDIASLGSAPMSYSFVGAIRYTEARNVSVRENIKQFINALKKVELSPISKDEVRKLIEESNTSEN